MSYPRPCRNCGGQVEKAIGELSNGKQFCFYPASCDACTHAELERRFAKTQAKQANKRAAKYNAGELLPGDVINLFSTYQKCLCCGVQGKGLFNGLGIDHIVPLSKGGKNSPDNLQALCWYCNVAKGRKTIDYRN